MNRVGSGQQGDVGTVVDDDADAARAGESDEGHGPLEQFAVVEALLAELNAVGPSLDRQLRDPSAMDGSCRVLR